ncbi:MAG: iron-containing alcohol dehydrogenase, partial [Bacteroidota bacterium]
HGFASSIGGRIEVPHGLLCGRLMAPVNRITLQALRERQAWSPALHKYETVGRLFHPKAEHHPRQWYADALIDLMARWTDKFELASLGQFGLGVEAFDEIVAHTSQKNHPIELSSHEVHQCLEAEIS